MELSIKERRSFLEEAENMSLQITNITQRLDYLSRISLAYKKIKDSSSFRTMNLKVQQLSQKAKIYKNLGESHWDLASFFRDYGVLDSAYYHFRAAYRSFDRMPVDSTSQSLRGRMLYSMGNIQDSYKDYLGAELSIAQALMIFQELDDNLRVYNCYNVLGVIANGMDNNKKSIEYYEKAMGYLDDLNSELKNRLSWQNQNNLSASLMSMEDYPAAKNVYYQLIKDKKLQSEAPKLYSQALASYAYCILKGENNLDGVSGYLDMASKINDSIGNLYNQARINQYYGELMMAQGDTAQAIQYARQSRNIAQETSNNDRLLEILRLLTQWDSDNAVAYSNAYYTLNENIKEEERAKRDKFARIRLETDEVIEENKFLTRQRQLWIAAAMALILMGIATMIIVTQRIHNNRLKFKQKQQESNQEIYNLMLSQQGKLKEGKQLEQKRISEELHDGILGQMLGIRLILSGLNEKGDPSAVEKRADFIEKLREVEEEIRTISHELSNASYQKFYNFIVSLEDLIDDIRKSSKISIGFEYSSKVDWDSLQGDIKINIYRIVQESLQNCVKHAKCNKVQVDMMVDDDMLELRITDNGIGFDTNKGKKGIGLRNVTSRVQKLKGTLKVDSNNGNGTQVLVQIPVESVVFNDEKQIEKTKQVLNV
ncbi:sensor histidine kinase [Flagellimonas meishanensis]|uniref:tetratricopeptide repeat-containing sensor histidine kinase n=1 Tax=Flagellimonas meishanensis TaxID=2873264 RepID=UPI001CA68B0F|nr:sensor histidine kinase [[Muricauda] meishanensis]